MYRGRKRRTAGLHTGDTNPYLNSYVAGVDEIAFTAGLPVDVGTLTLAPTYGNFVGSGLAAPLSNSNIAWASGAMEVGRVSGPVYRDGLTISNFDFRGINYGFTIYARDVTFENCIFDFSAWTLCQNAFFGVVATGHIGYVSFVNCYFDGNSSIYLVKEFITGPVKRISNCVFTNIPADWLFSPSRADTDDGTGTTVEYTYCKLASTSMDSATLLTATMTGKAWTNLSDSVTLTSGFTISTTTGAAPPTAVTNGGTVTFAAGTYTVQQILDTINATGRVIPSSDATQACLRATYLGGVLYLSATAWDNNGATSTGRSIDLSGMQSDWEKVFGTGTVSKRAVASFGNVPVTMTYSDQAGTPATATYYGAHADGTQCPGTYNTVNPISYYAVIIDMTTDTTDPGTANAQQTSPINITADLGDLYQPVTFDQCTTIISTNPALHPKKSQGSSNSIAKANLSGGRRFRELYRISNCLMQAGTMYTIRNVVSHLTTGSGKIGWATPSSFDSSGTDGDAITISDGTTTVTYTCAGGRFRGSELRDAINNEPGFGLEAYVTGSGASSAINIGGRRWGPDKFHSNYLVIGVTGTGTATTALTAFGLTAGTKTASGNGNFINPFSFEGNYDYDDPATPITITFDGSGAVSSYNPKPTAPSVTVGTVTSTTATITFTAQSAVIRWQYSVDDGANWSTLTNDGGSPTVTGTITGLSPDTAYTQCKVRGQNAWNDAQVLVNNGTASAAFTITTIVNSLTYDTADGFASYDKADGF